MKKKKILYLSQAYPYPPVSGGRIKTLNTLLALARNYSVHAVFISESMPTRAQVKALTDRGIKVKVFMSPGIMASVKDDLWGLAVHFFRGIPHYVFQHTHEPAGVHIKEAIKTIKPDVIHVDHLNMAQYLPEKKNERWVLEHHNAEAFLYWTRFIYTKKLLRKLYLGIELALTYVYERRILRKMDHVFAISEPEMRRLKAMFKVANVSVQPMVYSAGPAAPVSHKLPGILFVGMLGWPPNEDAIEWFVQSIFPLILLQIPDAQFHIVGKPDRRYMPSSKKNIVLHGFQHTLDTLLGQADVFVLPFRMGGGLRLKALTALSAGLPVVTTRLGVEGLGVRDQKECLIEDNPHRFAARTIEVLTNSKLRKSLRKSALAYVLRAHGEERNKDFLNTYNRAIL